MQDFHQAPCSLGNDCLKLMSLSSLLSIISLNRLFVNSNFAVKLLEQIRNIILRIIPGGSGLLLYGRSRIASDSIYGVLLHSGIRNTSRGICGIWIASRRVRGILICSGVGIASCCGCWIASRGRSRIASFRGNGVSSCCKSGLCFSNRLGLYFCGRLRFFFRSGLRLYLSKYSQSLQNSLR